MCVVRQLNDKCTVKLYSCISCIVSSVQMQNSRLYLSFVCLLFCIQLYSCADRTYLYTKLLPLNSNQTKTTHEVNTSHYEVSSSHPSPELQGSVTVLIKLEACNEHLDPHDNYTVLRDAMCPERIQRSVIKRDERTLVDPAVYPNKALVSISHRCNGVAIGYQYVLTSAQCAYFSYYTYPRVYGMWTREGVAEQREILVDKVLFPVEWIESTDNAERFKHNYALIKLASPQQTYIPIHMNTPTHNDSQCLHFKQLSYNFRDSYNDRGSINESVCSSRHETFSTSFVDCDSSVGDKGNPLLTVVNRNGHNVQTVSGILLGDYGQYYLDNLLGQNRFNLALRINYEVFLRLCVWMDKLDWCISYYREYFPMPSLVEFDW